MTGDKHPLPDQVSISFTVIEGPGSGRRYAVRELPALLGSGQFMDVLLTGSGVAEAHARLVLSGGVLFLEDMGGGGGTRINDLSAKRAQLRNGDILEIGELKLLAQISIPAGVSLEGPTGRGETRRGPNARVWVAGLTPTLREWFESDLGRTAGLETRAFRSGEEVLTEVSKELGNERRPDVLILDLRLPIINGINVAVATRAFELGFNRLDRIPLVFFFDPPEASNFDKVLNFCQPTQVVSPGDSEDSIRRGLTEIAATAVKSGQTR